MDNRELEIAIEIGKIALENNILVLDLIEEYKKAQSLTDQDKRNEPNTKTTDCIISDNKNLNNII